MKFVFLSLSLIFSSILFAQIKYENSFEEALSKAKKENKLVLVKYYSETCSHCQDLQKILEIDSVGKRYNEVFACFKIDADNLTEKDHAFIAKYKFNIDQVPYLFVFDVNGNFIHFSLPKIEINFIMKVPKMALNPKERTSYLPTKYEIGMRDENTLKMYCKMAHLLSNDSMEVQLGNDIYVNYSESQILSKAGLVTIAKYIVSIRNGMYRVWMDNFTKLDSLVPEFTYNEKKKVFKDIIINDINKNKTKWSMDDFELALKYLKIIDKDVNPYLYFWQEMSEKLLSKGLESEALEIGDKMIQFDKFSYGMNLYIIKYYLQKIEEVENLDIILTWIELQESLCTEPETIAKFKVQRISYYLAHGDKKGEQLARENAEDYITTQKLSKDLMNEVIK